MTKNDVVDAFIRGDLDRRGFIKRLTAVGVSSAAAMAYAGSLVQNTAAAPSNGSGFITRMQDADATYGPAVPIGNVRAAVQALLRDVLNFIRSLQSLLEDFDAAAFPAADLNETDRAVIQSILDQAIEQAEAIRALLNLPEQAGGQGAPGQAATGTLPERLIVLAELADEIAGEYAALVPALEELEQRELFSQIAIVAGRHAAILNYLAGNDPVPGAFEEPIDPGE
jgi:hypothetical protein